METTTPQETILLIEDDATFAKFVETIVEALGCSVVHFTAFPEGGLAAVKEKLEHDPVLSILDYSLPGTNGLEICKQLRTVYSGDVHPIVFLSGSSDADTILSCYEAGADDFISKPVLPRQLKAKIDHLLKEVGRRRRLKSELENSRDIAFKAISATSELGQTIRFLEQLFDCNSYQAIAECFFEALKPTGLRTCIKFFASSGVRFFSDDGIVRDIENKIMDEFREKGRIFDFRQRTVFNFNHVSLLVKNMPLDDPSNYGKLKDNLSILLNGADARTSAVESEELSQNQNRRIITTANVIKMMISDIEQNNTRLSTEFEDIIQELEFTITNAMMHFNMVEEEENKIMEIVSKAINRASSIFDRSIEQEKKYKVVMSDLTKTLDIKTKS